jgi:Cytochrome c554 and c-prime
VINRASALLVGVMVCHWSASAQDAAHLSAIVPGGIPSLPTVTSITQVSNRVTVTWDGPSGYYQLYEGTSARIAPSQPVGTRYNLLRSATVVNPPSPAFFRVAGTQSPFLSEQYCAECHPSTLGTVIYTPHAAAFTDPQFVALGGQRNPACLACHTTGFGAPTGYKLYTGNSALAGVQCENCHGAAANHYSNPSDVTAIPRVEVSGAMCGGCHNTNFVPAAVVGAHPPFYNEWSSSPHQPVVPDVAASFAATPSLISTCGRCHSATVREALLENAAVLPDATDASAVGIACATCHDPHQQFVYVNVLSGAVTNPVTGVVVTNGAARSTYITQLRNPVSSVQNYHTAGTWATNYNPAINLCGQCHNDRGALYTDTSRPPHYSPQYNMLIGTTGVINTNNPSAPHFNPASHALFITNQCVGCHMQTTPAPSLAAAGTAGHTFVVATYDFCAGCHGSALTASNLVIFVNSIITNQIQVAQSLLVQWATNKAPAILGTAAFGTNAWAYSSYTPPDNLAGGPGPTAALQARIPTNILIARFNLYLVNQDGSMGVHNALYAQSLLNLATNLVGIELSK